MVTERSQKLLSKIYTEEFNGLTIWLTLSAKYQQKIYGNTVAYMFYFSSYYMFYFPFTICFVFPLIKLNTSAIK